MEKYIQQLLSDIESIILQRWRECPPNFYQAGILDPYLVPPKGLDAPPEIPSIEDEDDDEDDYESTLEQAFAEIAGWLKGENESSMFSKFGLTPEQFPPEKQLSDNQLEELVEAILRLWASFNFAALISQKAPARVVYPLLLNKMLKGCIVMKHGQISVEFCHYDPEDCPFGKEYCSCTEFLDLDKEE